ncbi:META domain-containing protein [Tellurirhabdus bombi]|uniref:META domain-containing protein n=1 Tax=Tellurirhabdus bombi TaxID=2907205 RepID=UPI001F282740|nr:META domain-containing protein [Tellurirhabdus bombi]
MKTIPLIGYLTLLLFIFEGCHRKSTPDRDSNNGTDATVSADWNTKRRQGIDFTAFGNDTGWTLDVDFAKQTHFRAPGARTITMTTPKPQRSSKSRGVVLEAKDAKGRLLIGIDPVVSRDKKSGEEFAYTVWVESGGKRYNGMGSFLNGPIRLNTNWVLETFRGQRMRPEQFSGRLPNLTINTVESKVQGFAGCNEIRGNIKAEGDRIKLAPNTATRKYCASSFETAYLKTLQSVTLYRVAQNRLTLLADGQYVMTFRKR